MCQAAASFYNVDGELVSLLPSQGVSAMLVDHTKSALGEAWTPDVEEALLGAFDCGLGLTGAARAQTQANPTPNTQDDIEMEA